MPAVGAARWQEALLRQQEGHVRWLLAEQERAKEAARSRAAKEEQLEKPAPQSEVAEGRAPARDAGVAMPAAASKQQQVASLVATAGVKGMEGGGLDSSAVRAKAAWWDAALSKAETLGEVSCGEEASPVDAARRAAASLEARIRLTQESMRAPSVPYHVYERGPAPERRPSRPVCEVLVAGAACHSGQAHGNSPRLLRRRRQKKLRQAKRAARRERARAARAARKCPTWPGWPEQEASEHASEAGAEAVLQQLQPGAPARPVRLLDSSPRMLVALVLARARASQGGQSCKVRGVTGRERKGEGAG